MISYGLVGAPLPVRPHIGLNGDIKKGRLDFQGVVKALRHNSKARSSVNYVWEITSPHSWST